MSICSRVYPQAMFVAGKPFYPAHVESPEGPEEDSEVVAILNEANLTEYKVSSKELLSWLNRNHLSY